MFPSRLEQYLDQLEQPLAARPPAERREWREEARQHLLALIAAHEELGAPPEEAVEAALRQFGDARRIGRQVRRTTKRRHSLTADGREILAIIAGHIALLGWFSALMHVPGAMDQLPAVGLALGLIYWGAGALVGRVTKHLAPRAAGWFEAWAASYTALPYLTLVRILWMDPGAGDLYGSPGAKLLGAAACLSGLFLGARAACRARRRSETAEIMDLPARPAAG